MGSRLLLPAGSSRHGIQIGSHAGGGRGGTADCFFEAYTKWKSGAPGVCLWSIASWEYGHLRYLLNVTYN